MLPFAPSAMDGLGRTVRPERQDPKARQRAVADKYSYASGTGFAICAFSVQKPDNHPAEHVMEDRSTIQVTALFLAGLFLTCFTLAAISMP
jgi:hypothetical protein